MSTSIISSDRNFNANDDDKQMRNKVQFLKKIKKNEMKKVESTS